MTTNHSCESCHQSAIKEKLTHLASRSRSEVEPPSLSSPRRSEESEWLPESSLRTFNNINMIIYHINTIIIINKMSTFILHTRCRSPQPARCCSPMATFLNPMDLSSVNTITVTFSNRLFFAFNGHLIRLNLLNRFW